MLGEFNVADEMFYWARAGKRPTVLEMNCTLKEAVDAPALKSAFAQALNVHKNFRVQPVISENSIKTVIEDVAEPPLTAAEEAPKHLGTADTNGLMLYADYCDNGFTLHIFHGVADLRGIYDFLKTLLHFYFREVKGIPYDAPAGDSADTAHVFEDLVKNSSYGEAGNKYIPKEHEVFYIPEPGFSKETTRQRLFEIDVPLTPLLSFAKQNGSSVVPVLQALIGRAVRKAYSTDGKDVVAYTPVDLRRVFGLETGGNCASSFPLPYTEELDKCSMNERARLLRGMMETEMTPENLFDTVAKTIKALRMVTDLPIPVEKGADIAVSTQRTLDIESYTYGISYPGKIDFGKETDKYVESVCARAGSYSYPMWIIACEFGGTIRMTVTQNYESDVLVKAIYEEIKDIFPATTFEDRGYHTFDEFHLEELRHIGNQD